MTYSLVNINVQDGSDNVFLYILLAVINFFILYFILHFFIFSEYPILYEFICGYDIRADYNRELKPEEKLDFNKFKEEICKNYSHFRLVNILYFTSIFVTNIIIFAFSIGYVLIIILDIVSIVLIVVFMNIFVEVSGLVNLIGVLYNSISFIADDDKQIESRTIGKIVFDAMTEKQCDKKMSNCENSVESGENVDQNQLKSHKEVADSSAEIKKTDDDLRKLLGNLLATSVYSAIEYIRYAEAVENKISELKIMASVYLGFCVMLLVLTCLFNLFPVGGLYLYINNGSIEYNFISNWYHDSLINENGLVKFCIQLDFKIKSCLTMPTQGTCIELTVTKGKNNKCDISYVVFENGVKVPDKFNLKRFNTNI